MAAHLAQEMTVQAAAIEAARSNVEHHYSYICTHFREFMAWWGSPPGAYAGFRSCNQAGRWPQPGTESFLLGSPATCQHIAN